MIPTQVRTGYKKEKGKDKYYIGVDGEGQGRSISRWDKEPRPPSWFWHHRYTLLAWSDSEGIESDYIEDTEGLSTVECLDFLLRMPTRAKAFSYAFNYDLTKMFTDMDNETLFKLFRPELRKRAASSEKFGPYPVHWVPPNIENHAGYLINLQGTKLTIEEPVSKFQNRKKKQAGRRRVVWDVFKFFQSKFTSALVDWKVATFEELETMREMKDKRAEFDQLDRDEIRKYCLDECAKMAILAKSLVDAHEDAGLTLKSFYGAGSTGGAMLKKMGIDKQKRTSFPEMHEAIACGFFGGRFENSVIGEVKGPLWSYDISSAYPYETTFLPCLECGKWELTQRRADLHYARVALVRYSLGKSPPNLSWGPFPFRLKDGSICYPVESGGGWVWDKEFIEGERIFPHVKFEEAWIYKTDCDHQPFKDIPEYYLVRLKIGKEGKGIVIKLGVNSVYGKLAQSIGDAPPFQCWIWAGLITSGTRSQILRALSLHKDPANLLMVATDGICSRERLTLPEPRNTYTMTEHKKPLGGWEEKEVKKGVFFVRPGIYFPLSPTAEELKTVRARGVGRAVMFNAWQMLVDAWNSEQEYIKLADVTRFCGAKSSISVARDKETGGLIYNRSPLYGEWIKRPVELTFNPLPKREAVLKNRDGSGRLLVRRFPKDLTSEPYDNAIKSQEALLLKMLNEEAIEQPDGGDYCDYENE